MKKVALATVIFIVLAICGGCATDSKNQPQDTPAAASAASQTPSITPEEEGPPMSAQPAETETAASPVPSQSPEESSATGIYQGQADNNFIEIKIDGEPEESAYMVFMLTGDIKSSFDGMKLDAGNKVDLKYYKNDAGQLVLTKLDRLET